MSLSANLHEYLLMNGKVSLPFIGQFELIRKKAEIVSSEYIHPPGVSVHFIANKFVPEIWEKFKHFMARKNDLGLQHVEHTVQHELQYWVGQLRSGEEVSIFGLGKLSGGTAEAELKFSPQLLQNDILPGLKKINLDRIIRKEESNKAKTEVTLAIGKSASGLPVFWKEIGIGFMIFLLLCLGYYLFQLSSCAKQTKIKNPLVELTHIDDSRLNKDPAEFVNANNHQDSGIQNEETDIAVWSDTALESGETVPVLPEKESPSDSLLDSDTQIINADCIIILGSFLKHKNADDLSSRLSDLGLKVYNGSNGQYERVGVYEPCDELMTSLNKYRSTIDTGAWILQ